MYGIQNDNTSLGRKHTRLILFMIVAALMGATFIAVGSGDNEVSAAPESVSVSTKQQLVNAINDAVDGQVIIVTADIEIDTTLRITKKVTLTAQSSGLTISPSNSFKEADILAYGSSTEYVKNPGMFYIDADVGASLTLGETTLSPLLTLDAKGESRVIYNTRQVGERFVSLLINSAYITGGYVDDYGAGVYNTHGSDAVMKGGSISDNRIGDVLGYSTVKYSNDVWNGSGAHMTIAGGNVGYILQNTQSTTAGYVKLQGDGHIDWIYVVWHNSGKASTFHYEGGTVDHILLSSKENNGNPYTFTQMEVQNPQIGVDYSPETHYDAELNQKRDNYDARIGETSYYWLHDAIKLAASGDTIEILRDCYIDHTTVINKKITLTSSSAVTIKASNDFEDLTLKLTTTNPEVNPKISSHAMILINGSSSNTTELILGESTSSPPLTFDADAKCRVIYNFTMGGTTGFHNSLTINSANITRGLHDYQGAGVFNTYMGGFVMNGGTISGNSLSYETRYHCSKDVFNGSGAKASINGGTIDYWFQHSTAGGNKVGNTTLSGGTIKNMYLDYSNDDDILSTFLFETGTVENLHMETAIISNPYDKRPFNTIASPRNGEYHSGDAVVLIGASSVTGYRTLHAAYEAASADYYELMLLMDVVLSEPLVVTKNIVLKQASILDSTDGYTVTPANNDSFLTTGAMIKIYCEPTQSVAFELDGPTLDGGGKYRCIKVQNGALTLTSGTVTNGYVGEEQAMNLGDNKVAGAGIELIGASFSMLGGAVINNAVYSTNDIYCIYSADISSINTEAIVNGGTIDYMACLTAESDSSTSVSGSGTVISNLLLGSSIDGGGFIYRAIVNYSDGEGNPAENIGLNLDYVSDKSKVYPVSELNDGDAYYAGVSVVKWYRELASLNADEEPLEIDKVLFQDPPSSPYYDGEVPVKDFDEQNEIAYAFLGWRSVADSALSVQPLYENNEQMSVIDVIQDMVFYGDFDSYVPAKYDVIGNVSNGGLDKAVAYYHQPIILNILSDDQYVVPGPGSTVTVTIGGAEYPYEYDGDGIIDIPAGVVNGDIIVTASCIRIVAVHINDNDPGLSGVKYTIEGEEERNYPEGDEGIIVEYGKKLTLRAVLKDGFEFVMWATDITGNPYTFEAIESVEFTPVTKEDVPDIDSVIVTVITDVKGLENVQFKINGDAYKYYEHPLEVDVDATVELLVTLSSGCEFGGWIQIIDDVENEIVSTDNPYEFSVSGTMVLKPKVSFGSPNPDPTPTPPRPKPTVITVNVSFDSTVGGDVDAYSIKVPLNSKVTSNGDTLIFGSGSNAIIVKAKAYTGFTFDSWSIEDGNIMADCNVTAKFRAITLVNIAVEVPPIKTDYKVGEKFDPVGLVVIAEFDNMSSMTIGYEDNNGLLTFSPSLDTPLKASDTKVSVYYNGHSADIAITVSSDSGDDILLYIIIAAIIVSVLVVVAFFLRKRAAQT